MGIVRKQSIISSFYNYLGLIIGVISTALVFPKIIDNKEWGLILLLTSAPMLFSEFCSLGFGGAIQRLFPIFKTKDHKNNGLFMLMLLIVIVGFIIFCFIFPIISKRYLLKGDDADFVLKYIVLFLPMTLVYLMGNMLDVYVRYDLLDSISFTFAKEFLVKIFLLLGAFLFYIEWLSYINLLYYIILINTIPVFILLYKLKKNNSLYLQFEFGFLNKQLIIKIIRLCAIVLIFGIASILLSNFDVMVIQKYLGLESVSVFKTVFIFGSLVSVPMRIIHKTVAPILREAFYHNQTHVVKDIYYKSVINQTIFAFLIIGLVLLNIDNILYFLPYKYTLGKYVIVWICIGCFFDMVTGVNDALIGMSKYYIANSLIALFISVIYYFLANYLTPLKGINGTALAYAITFFIFNVLRYSFILFFFKFQPFDKKFFLIILFGLSSIFVTYFIPQSKFPILNLTYISLIFASIFMFLVIYFRCSIDINDFIKKNVFKYLKWNLNI